MVSSKTLPKDLNLKFRSKFNPAFTNYCYLHCAILKVYRVLKKQGKDSLFLFLFLFQNVQNEIFVILKIFQKYMKFTRVAYWIESKTLTLWLLLLLIMLSLLKLFTSEQLHFLKSLKVNRSNMACSSSIRPIFNK